MHTFSIKSLLLTYSLKYKSTDKYIPKKHTVNMQKNEQYTFISPLRLISLYLNLCKKFLHSSKENNNIDFNIFLTFLINRHLYG
ncbi:hypothetical protein CSC2_45680 [Clostridium zeae]|uniref:Uncharacterized protein n=1 Tax=Clostridium zeae TaxID=2759022 RepID=A0ABQ1EGU0_9CLOT|nr:hypothetical protein CSC2_45680 [Clostridium zeae]